MAEVLLLNPAKRRKARRRNPSPAQLRARARFAAMARGRSRRRNPSPRIAARNLAGSGSPKTPYESNPRRRRRRNPIRTYRSAVIRRRRNPISLGGLSINSIMGTVREAAVQGAGAVVMDMGYGYVQRYLPASLQAGPGQATAGAAVKALLTVVAGKLLSRATGGLSQKAALGALTVQARDLVSGMLPAGTVAGLGYAVPGRVINRSARIGPNRLSAYLPPGSATPLLNAYTTPGTRSPLLSGSGNARQREGFMR